MNICKKSFQTIYYKKNKNQKQSLTIFIINIIVNDNLIELKIDKILKMRYFHEISLKLNRKC